MASIRTVTALVAVLLFGCEGGDRRTIANAAQSEVETAGDDIENLARDAENQLRDARQDLSGDASDLADRVYFDPNARRQ